MVRQNLSGSASYPADRTSGDLVSNTTNSYALNSSLTSAITYYYSLWTYDTNSGKWCDNRMTITGTTTGGNQAPTVDFKTPTNSTTSVSPCPAVTCEAYVNDTDGDTLNVTWATNESGSWVNKHTNTSVSANSTLSYQFSNFSNYSQIYYWRVYVDDSEYNISEIYHFTTSATATSVDTISPYNQTASPLTVNATGDSCLDNVTLYYRYSTDNSSWGSGGGGGSENWWNSDWSYRKNHTIQSSAGAGTNYQVQIKVVNSSGSDSGSTIYIDDKALGNFNDIRFINYSDNSTVLDYWIEEVNTDANATFWVEIPENLSSANQQIWIYYGNSSATNISNGTNTFVFFDDFSGDLSKWDNRDPGDITITSGYLQITGGSTGGDYGWADIGSNVTYEGFTDGVIEADVLLGSNSIAEVSFRGNRTANTGYKSRMDERVNQGLSHLKPPYSGWGLIGTASGAACPAGWGTMEITVSGTSLKIDAFGQTKSVTDSDYSGPGEISLQNHYGTTSGYDNVRVRKYVSSEPAHGGWGSEEQYSAGSGWQMWSDASNPDTSYSWSWDFNFPNNTGYYEFYSIGQKTGSTDESAPGSADAICHYEGISVPIVITNASTGVEETNATLHGYLSSNGSADTTCGFRYGTSSGSYSENFSKGTISSGSEFSNNNGSLTSGDLYYYQAWANNSQGFATGSELMFFTKPEDPDSISVSSVSGTTASCLVDKADMGGGATSYTYVRYNTGSAPSTRAEGSLGFNSTSTTPEITGLSMGTHYYGSAWAWGEESSTGQFSDTYVTFEFNTSNIPIVVSNASTGVEETNATLHGYLSSNGSADTTCGFRYGTSSGSYSENFSKGVTANLSEFSNNNGSLTSGDLYYFQAWANNSAGFASGSELTFFTKPPVTTSFAESASTNTTLTYTWSEATVGSGATAYTRVQYKTGSSPTSISDGANTYNGTAETDDTTSLTPGTRYYFSAFSWGIEAGVGAWNDTYATMDAWTNPGDPTNVDTTNDSTWVNVTFTHGSNGEYTMVRRNASGSADYPADRSSGTLVANTTNTYANDTGLTNSVTYYYSLWTFDPDGDKWCDNQVNITGTTTAPSNNPPKVDYKTPTNESTGISPCPAVTCDAYVNDTEGNNLNVTWATNESGSWVNKHTNTSVTANTTVSYQYSNFSNYSKIYYWRVYVHDGTSNISETYHFTTSAIATSVDAITPYNQTTSPLSTTATGNSCLDNVSLYYRWSDDNSSWGSGGGGGSENWWNTNWGYRKLITINSSQVNQTLSNFPILVNRTTDSSLASYAQDDGDDITFILHSDNSTKLNHEIENYSSGTLWAWVNITSLSSSVDTKIWMYYGNSTCNSQENISGTWDSNFGMVQHLNESSGTLFDSTTNDNDGTNSGASYSATGKIATAMHFEDTETDYINCGNALSPIKPMTVSVWVKPESVGVDDQMVSKGFDGVNTQWELKTTDAAGKTSFRGWIGSTVGVESNDDVDAGIWDYIVGTYDGTTWKIYWNGIFDNSATAADPEETVRDLCIGTVQSGVGTYTQYWDGDID